MVRLFLILSVSATCAACASTGAVPRPFPLPSGAPTPPPTRVDATPEPAPPTVPRRPGGPTGIADGYSISSTALSLRGAPYRNGGLDPAGFDCSGFVKYVFEQHGVPMPRDTRNQFSVGKEIDPGRLEPGDLVFFTTIAPGASHVGIAVGGDQFVHAPSTSGVVRVENLSSQYWSTRFIGAKRVN
jgi:cell wall-associated NlpC family hydrolase